MVGINAPYYTIGYQSVRRVDATKPSYSLVNEFPTGRWYPGIMTLPDGNVLVVGGAQIVRLWPACCQTYQMILTESCYDIDGLHASNSKAAMIWQHAFVGTSFIFEFGF